MPSLRVMVIHGPNLNLLGAREPEIYGGKTLAEINQLVQDEAKTLGMEVRCGQSNSEGEIVNMIHEAGSWAQAIVINPAAYTHTSVAIYDALQSVRLPAIEVHLSNIWARGEEFRHRSLTAGVCVGVVAGFQWASYVLALRALRYLAEQGQL
jgi:3-dehydroquinate dehydratase-2